MNGHIATGKVGLDHDLRDRNVRVEGLAVDGVSVTISIVGEGKILDSGAGIAGKLQSNSNHAIFKRKNQEGVREKGKGEAPRGNSRR